MTGDSRPHPLEYAALLTLEEVIRIAIKVPNTGEFIVTALAALDQVRAEHGITPPPMGVMENRPKPKPKAPEGPSTLLRGLIGRLDS